MRRFVLSLILLALVIAICCVSTVSVNQNAGALHEQMSDAMDALLQGDRSTAQAKAAACETYWEDSGLPFFVYLDHSTFNELELLIHSIPVFIPINRQLAEEQIQRCCVILKNIMDQQKVNAENIF